MHFLTKSQGILRCPARVRGELHRSYGLGLKAEVTEIVLTVLLKDKIVVEEIGVVEMHPASE